MAITVVRYFLGYGILITMSSMVLGLPLANLIERLKIGRWWSYLAFAAATGALLGALSSHPILGSCAAPIPGSGEQDTCIENPFALTFSPWTRSEPGFAGEDPPIQWSDYIGTIAFGAIVGGVLGISFWYFHRYRTAETALHVRISADTCLIGKFEVACSNVGAKLLELGTPLDAPIHVSGGEHASFSATSTALESLRSAGFKLKIGYINVQGK